ncbi:MAG: SPOR domain-containing protein [Spirochaetaceae bacterium]|nr:MAG: SPOR domain-containing protein [Spirochaetaceae bacterium]
MERNRVLWVIFSISLFLVVVLAGGLYLLRPVSEKDAGVAAGQTPPVRGFDAFEYVRGKSQLPELAEEPEEAEEMVIIVGEREETPPEQPTEVLEPPEKAVQPTVDTRITQTRPAATAPTVARPVARPTTTPRAAAPAASRPTTAQKPAPRPREVSVTEYWIQAGSYTSPSRAQEVTAALEDQGLVAKITTRAISGNTYYRVRIGPYLSKAEAEKFLEWVKAVKGFESSYISMVQAKRRYP